MIIFKSGIENLPLAFKIYLDVFKPTEQEKITYGGTPEDWQEKLKDGLCLVAYYNDKPAGFAACVNRQESLHIWNIGTPDTFRGKGIWKAAEAEIVKYAEGAGFSRLTVNTYQSTWPVMYASLSTLGYTLLKEEGTPDGVKSRFVKYLV